MSIGYNYNPYLTSSNNSYGNFYNPYASSSGSSSSSAYAGLGLGGILSNVSNLCGFADTITNQNASLVQSSMQISNQNLSAGFAQAQAVTQKRNTLASMGISTSSLSTAQVNEAYAYYTSGANTATTQQSSSNDLMTTLLMSMLGGSSTDSSSSDDLMTTLLGSMLGGSSTTSSSSNDLMTMLLGSMFGGSSSNQSSNSGLSSILSMFGL